MHWTMYIPKLYRPILLLCGAALFYDGITTGKLAAQVVAVLIILYALVKGGG